MSLSQSTVCVHSVPLRPRQDQRAKTTWAQGVGRSNRPAPTNGINKIRPSEGRPFCFGNSREQAAYALEKLGWKGTSAFEQAYIAAYTGDLAALVRLGSQSTNALIEILERPGAPAYAYEALGEVGDEHAVDKLLSNLIEAVSRRKRIGNLRACWLTIRTESSKSAIFARVVAATFWTSAKAIIRFIAAHYSHLAPQPIVVLYDRSH